MGINCFSLSNIRRKNTQPLVEDNPRTMNLSSADLVSHDDILTLILLRLPFKSLARFKCVSKHWQYLLSTPRFLLLQIPDTGLFLRRWSSTDLSYSTPDYVYVPFDQEKPFKPHQLKTIKFVHKSLEILQSCNGLMLCATIKRDKYYVFNPTTNQFVTLPKLNNANAFIKPTSGIVLAVLAFDPVLSPHYRVICIHLYHSCHIQVYASENNRWKVSGSMDNFPNGTMNMNGGVYWNDAIHWINIRGFVLYHKINENSFNKIPLPFTPDYIINEKSALVVKSRDSLLFMNVFPSGTTNVDVFEMNKDYSGWTMKYHVDLSFSNTPLIVHCLVLGEREEDAFLVLESNKTAIRFNLVSQTCKKLCYLNSSLYPLGSTAFLFNEYHRQLIKKNRTCFRF